MFYCTASRVLLVLSRRVSRDASRPGQLFGFAPLCRVARRAVTTPCRLELRAQIAPPAPVRSAAPARTSGTVSPAFASARRRLLASIFSATACNSAWVRLREKIKRSLARPRRDLNPLLLRGARRRRYWETTGRQHRQDTAGTLLRLAQLKSLKSWRARRDSNTRPLPSEGNAGFALRRPF